WMDYDQRALRDFILLDVMTGSRKSALVAARWDEFDLHAATWTIPPWNSKNKMGQLVPLGEYEIDILRERQEYLSALGTASLFVFPGSGKTGHQFKRSWPSLRRRLGLDDVTIHDLRRSLAATMASANVNLVLIKNALNHGDIKTTAKVYARTNKQAELEARQTAHRIWLEAAKAEPINRRLDRQRI
ncbi:MAG: tyrosine-type recombinase/integrase, partial [Candidatus Obscuribacterales bacterium]